VPTANCSADCRACAGTDRSPTQRTLPWIIGVGAGGKRQNDTEHCSGRFDQSQHDIEIPIRSRTQT
jgi:hypothetical protein